MKYIEDGRSLVERNHDAREYCYQCRREREARMNRIVRRCLVVSSMIFMWGGLCERYGLGAP